ncbi:CheR family methyltransferase [Algicola sagamiensis]|uniref:CheR family methyltransferase n=1 Tax=Algicola sagamiensis TaxID=163869 RepID=UPI00036653D4|nr:protein-glutamate O-methyltransferase CheR [Algicola sagamiensis]
MSLLNKFQQSELSQENYMLVCQWMRERCGVDLGETRQTLVQSRLFRRATKFRLQNVNEYIQFLNQQDDQHPEWVFFVDLLTTHETYFFREAQHFDFLQQMIFNDYRNQELSIASAACSTGEEVYTLAFVCAEFFGLKGKWHVHGMDIAKPCLESAQSAIYPEARAKQVPQHMLKKYMLKGVNEAQGLCLVKDSVKEKVSFSNQNILQPMNSEQFDVIFCRNVLIYFDKETKQKVVENLYRMLKPGGYLFVSLTEQLREFAKEGDLINTSILRKI